MSDPALAALMGIFLGIGVSVCMRLVFDGSEAEAFLAFLVTCYGVQGAWR